MTDWPSVLGGATFAGIFGFIVAWYTNKQADKRADADRTERAQIRAEDREQQNNRRIHEQGMDAVHRFLSAVSLIQTVSYYYKSSPQQVTSAVSEMEAARWGVAAYFPGSLYEMTDMTRMAALSFMSAVATGDKRQESASSATLRASLHELMLALHIELGHDFALAEQKRAVEEGERLEGS